MEWQPIEAAPKDGTHILLLIDGEIIEGFWDRLTRTDGSIYEPDEWDVVRLPSHGCGCCSYDNAEPSHWMPLPEPPQ